MYKNWVKRKKKYDQFFSTTDYESLTRSSSGKKKKSKIGGRDTEERPHRNMVIDAELSYQDYK